MRGVSGIMLKNITLGSSTNYPSKLLKGKNLNSITLPQLASSAVNDSLIALEPICFPHRPIINRCNEY